MSQKPTWIVEVIVCRYDADGTRWKADGRVVAEVATKAEEQVP